jgi:tetratricopeptide (TPR) repeat protein
MALGYALTLAGTLLLSADRCEFLVRGIPEPQTPFLRLVDLYRKGELPASELSRFSHAEREAFLEHLKKVRQWRYASMTLTREPDDSCIQSVSLIETETAVRLAQGSRWDLADARFDGAWKTSYWIEDETRRRAFQRKWLLAAGLLHHELVFATVPEEAFARADRFFDNAIRRYPEDAEILLAAGALREWSGSLPWGNASHLREAESLYARARPLDPDDPVLLLRHGLVLERLGREQEAAVPLAHLLELAAREDTVYRAHMALGKIAEASGRIPEAVAHYEAASAAVPSWQASRIALGHALHASGEHERARAILKEAFALDRKTGDEAFQGFWSYELGLSLRFEPLLEQMRSEVMR